MLLLSVIAVAAIRGQGVRKDPVMGRWDLTIERNGRKSVGWLEVRASGLNALVGRFMCAFGSSRPVSEVISDETGVHFAIPTQWEAKTGTLRFDGHVNGQKIEGELSGPVFQGSKVTGVLAPDLAVIGPVSWGAPERLIGKTLEANWVATPGWVLENGLLSDKQPRHDINSKTLYKDFKLHAEFRYPKDSNSGIYLRGRYEVQIDDAYGLPADDEHIGGIYGLIQPRVNAAKPPDEWQSVDIVLVGRTVSVKLNGISIIENQEIAGPTGGALDADEAAPGPIKLQGDHGPIEFRNIIVWPRRV